MNEVIKKVIDKGDINALKELLSGGLDLSIKDELGNTLLHYAVKKKQLRIVEILILNRVDVNIKNDNGESPLDVCETDKWNPGSRDNASSEIADLLRNHGDVGLASQPKAIEINPFIKGSTTNKEPNRLPYILAFNFLLFGLAAAYYYFVLDKETETQAIETKTQTIKILSSNEVFIATSRSRVHFNKGEYDQGLAVVDQALKSIVTPDLLEIKFDILFNQTRYAVAYLVALELIKIEPKKSLWHYRANVAAYNANPRSRRAAAALPHVKKWYELNPMTRSKVIYANTLVESGSSKDGFKLFDELITVDVQKDFVWMNYRMSLWENKDFDLAEKVFRTALNKDKNNFNLNLYLGEVLDQNGEKEEAVKYYRASLKLRPRPNTRAAKRILEITGKPVPSSLEKTEGKIEEDKTEEGKKEREIQGGKTESFISDMRADFSNLAYDAERKGLFGEAVEYYEKANKFADAVRLIASKDTESSNVLRKYNKNEIIDHCKKACVTVFSASGHGSGFFIAPEGWLLTNEHVVKGGRKVEVEFEYKGKPYPAKIIDVDERRDIALLKIEKDHPFYLKLGDSRTVQELDPVITLGTPNDRSNIQTYTLGKILQRANQLLGSSSLHFMHDAEIHGGNSGGPLINFNRRVIGINNATPPEIGFLRDKSYAIKINEVHNMLRKHKVPGY
jgi:S1-C subfamily serine protease